jgi:hypothetical protein
VCGVHRRQRPGGSGCTSWKGGIGRTSGGEAATTDLREGSNAPRLAGPTAERRDSETGACRAWQGHRSSGAPRRASSHVLGGGRRADKRDRKRKEWIGISG